MIKNQNSIFTRGKKVIYIRTKEIRYQSYFFWFIMMVWKLGKDKEKEWQLGMVIVDI